MGNDISGRINYPDRVHEHCRELCREIRHIGYIPFDKFECRWSVCSCADGSGVRDDTLVNDVMKNVKQITYVKYMGFYMYDEDIHSCYFLITERSGRQFLLEVLIREIPFIITKMIYNVLNIMEESSSITIMGGQDTRYIYCKFDKLKMFGMKYDCFRDRGGHAILNSHIISIENSIIIDFIKCERSLTKFFAFPSYFYGLKCKIISDHEHDYRKDCTIIKDINIPNYQDRLIQFFNDRMNIIPNNDIFVQFVVDAILKICMEINDAIESHTKINNISFTMKINICEMQKRMYSVILKNECDEILRVINTLQNSQCDVSHDEKNEPLSILLLRAVVYEHSLMLYRRMIQFPMGIISN